MSTLRESRHRPNVTAIPPRMPKPMNTPTTIRITLSALPPFGEAAAAGAAPAAAGATLAELPPTEAPQEVQKLFPSTSAEPHFVQKFAMGTLLARKMPVYRNSVADKKSKVSECYSLGCPLSIR